MKKTILSLVAVASLAVSGLALAGDFTLEGDRGDALSQYKVSVSETYSVFKLSGEAETFQPYGNGTLTQIFAAGAGLSFKVAGVGLEPYAQAGEKVNSGSAEQPFVGVGLNLTHEIVGPLSLTVGYRYRDSLNGAHFDEKRENAALTLTLSKKQSVGLVAYHYDGTTVSPSATREGVFYKYSF